MLVSSVPPPPEWRHTAVGTSGSPPFCGRWRQHGTGQWTCSPLGTRMAPSTHRRTVWHCCWTSCSHTVTKWQRHTHRHREEDTETLSARDDADSVVLKTKREMYRESRASCSVFSMCHLFLNSILSLLFPFSSTFQQGNCMSPGADKSSLIVQLLGGNDQINLAYFKELLTITGCGSRARSMYNNLLCTQTANTFLESRPTIGKEAELKHSKFTGGSPRLLCISPSLSCSDVCQSMLISNTATLWIINHLGSQTGI